MIIEYYFKDWFGWVWMLRIGLVGFGWVGVSSLLFYLFRFSTLDLDLMDGIIFNIYPIYPIYLDYNQLY